MTFLTPIVDALSNAERYASLHSFFPTAFEFLRRPDLADLSFKRHDIDGDRVFCLLSKT
jgi:beta-galactosidase beta subunit